MSDTIAALATPAGVASVGIVRLSGSDALQIASKLLRKPPDAPREASLRSIYDENGKLIDVGLVIYFASPKSFTGEDIVEFQCHGGVVVLQTILQSLLSCGARLAKPGEFSKRAFLNGKIDLSEAEAIAKMIEVKSTYGAHILARQMKGELQDFVERVRKQLLEAVAHAEVLIDYAEEDIPSNLTEEIVTKLNDITHGLQRLLDSSKRRRGIIEGFRVAIIGKPNVGKSSLLNALLSFDRAIVSDIAGTTRDTIEEEIRIGSHVVRIIDTAGIREGSDAVEKIGIKRSIDAVKEADVIIALFDRSRPLDEQDEQIINLLKRYDEKICIVALNKSDLKKGGDFSKLECFEPIEIDTLAGYDILLELLQKRLDAVGSDEELMLVSQRQMGSIEVCMQEIHSAKSPLLHGELEFFSFHLQNALKELSILTKPYSHEEVLDAMFSSFCLGK